MEMTEVLAQVGYGVDDFARRVHKVCGLEFEEAQQQLIIKAWKASKEYEPKAHTFGFARYAMTVLYFEHRHIIQKEARNHRMSQRALQRLAEKRNPEIEDLTQLMIDRIAYQQIVEKLPIAEQEVRRLRMAGYNYCEIAEKTHKSMGWISKTLRKKSEIAMNKVPSFV